MTNYKSKFKRDMKMLQHIKKELERINEEYTEVRMFLKQFAVIPDHSKHYLTE